MVFGCVRFYNSFVWLPSIRVDSSWFNSARVFDHYLFQTKHIFRSHITANSILRGQYTENNHNLQSVIENHLARESICCIENRKNWGTHWYNTTRITAWTLGCNFGNKIHHHHTDKKRKNQQSIHNKKFTVKSLDGILKLNYKWNQIVVFDVFEDGLWAAIVGRTTYIPSEM